MGKLKEVKGTEAGYSGEEQIKIMLQRITTQGGVAQTGDLYDAMESLLNPKGMTLSKQGKSSVRFFINEVAVKKGYVFPHNKNQRGWRITPTGQQWLNAPAPEQKLDLQLPNTEHIIHSEQPPTLPQRQQSKRRSSNSTTQISLGVTLEMLQQTRKYMPEEEFRRSWGMLYDQLLAEERARAITPINTKELMTTVLERLQRIQDFLQGNSSDIPKSEELCDWIHFCYTLTLYREVTALWPFVHSDDVNHWQYERTKRLATACRTRLGY